MRSRLYRILKADFSEDNKSPLKFLLYGGIPLGISCGILGWVATIAEFGNSWFSENTLQLLWFLTVIPVLPAIAGWAGALVSMVLITIFYVLLALPILGVIDLAQLIGIGCRKLGQHIYRKIQELLARRSASNEPDEELGNDEDRDSKDIVLLESKHDAGDSPASEAEDTESCSSSSSHVTINMGLTSSESGVSSGSTIASSSSTSGAASEDSDTSLTRSASTVSDISENSSDEDSHKHPQPPVLPISRSSRQYPAMYARTNSGPVQTRRLEQPQVRERLSDNVLNYLEMKDNMSKLLSVPSALTDKRNELLSLYNLDIVQSEKVTSIINDLFKKSSEGASFSSSNSLDDLVSIVSAESQKTEEKERNGFSQDIRDILKKLKHGDILRIIIFCNDLSAENQSRLQEASMFNTYDIKDIGAAMLETPWYSKIREIFLAQSDSDFLYEAVAKYLELIFTRFPALIVNHEAIIQEFVYLISNDCKIADEEVEKLHEKVKDIIKEMSVICDYLESIAPSPMLAT